MEEKKIIYQIILDIWELTKKYVFKPLDDDGWEQFCNEAGVVSNNYRKCSKDVGMLFSDIFTAITKYKAAKDKNGVNNGSC